MSYTPTEWKTGDIVSSQKLNKLEEGVANAGGVMFINVNGTNDTLDKTWQEIYDAMVQGKMCMLRETIDIPDSILTRYTVISEYSYGGGVYDVRVNTTLYRALSATGYPAYIVPDVLTIEFDANGGEGEIEDILVYEGESIESLPDGSELTAPEGKVFGGWATTDDATEADVTAPYTPDNNTTLYAVWIDDQT